MANCRELFRAPPPSPVTSGRQSSVANDEILTEFLNNSLRVPDLILPDRLSPRQNSKIQNLPKVDFGLLASSFEDQSINNNPFDVIKRTGCFELVNHGISDQLIRSVADYGGRIMELSPEKKAAVSRSGDRRYGFVEFHDEHNEEFVWCKDDDEFRSKLEAILPLEYSNFSGNLEIFTSEFERILGIIQKFLLQNLVTRQKSESEDDKVSEKQFAGSICYFYRHHHDVNTIQNDNEYTNSLRYEMIRMLIRGSEHSHTLCLHVCNGSSEFHAYSKKGWESYHFEKDALVITIGDQLQKWSEGKYKHVMGRPICKGEEDYISMSFLYNPPTSSPVPVPIKEKKTISLGHQALLFLILTIFYKIYFN